MVRFSAAANHSSEKERILEPRGLVMRSSVRVLLEFLMLGNFLTEGVHVPMFDAKVVCTSSGFMRVIVDAILIYV